MSPTKPSKIPMPGSFPLIAYPKLPPVELSPIPGDDHDHYHDHDHHDDKNNNNNSINTDIFPNQSKPAPSLASASASAQNPNLSEIILTILQAEKALSKLQVQNSQLRQHINGLTERNQDLEQSLHEVRQQQQQQQAEEEEENRDLSHLTDQDRNQNRLLPKQKQKQKNHQRLISQVHKSYYGDSTTEKEKEEKVREEQIRQELRQELRTQVLAEARQRQIRVNKRIFEKELERLELEVRRGYKQVGGDREERTERQMMLEERRLLAVEIELQEDQMGDLVGRLEAEEEEVLF